VRIAQALAARSRGEPVRPFDESAQGAARRIEVLGGAG